jgi:hypothetical protein
MKLVFRTLAFHILCIVTFAIIYWNISSNFKSPHTGSPKLLDFLFLSTTVQAGVGLSDFYPQTSLATILLITQQLMMILTNIVVIYMFSIF